MSQRVEGLSDIACDNRSHRASVEQDQSQQDRDGNRAEDAKAVGEEQEHLDL